MDAIEKWLQQQRFHPVVPLEKSDRMIAMDFTANNTALTDEILRDTMLFCDYINKQLTQNDARYGIGGYAEHRTIYGRSAVFDDATEPRRLHLGIDIWGAAGTPVFAPLGGTVHSFAFHEHLGNYGAVIILKHEVRAIVFHTLYGHLKKLDLENLYEGKKIDAGACFAHFGEPQENGWWPPHLHFQIIKDMQQYTGDYPGVCRFSEKDFYLANCPDPDLILHMNDLLK